MFDDQELHAAEIVEQVRQLPKTTFYIDASLLISNGIKVNFVFSNNSSITF